MHLDSIRDRLILVLDTETTGLDVANDRVVELGAVYFWRGEMVGRPLNIRINPERPIPPKATETHKITDADVANAPTFAQVAPRLLAHLSGDWANKNLRQQRQTEDGIKPPLVEDGRFDPPLVAGYNILSYDAPLLDAEFLRSNIAVFEPMACSEIIDPIVFVRWHHPDKPGRLVDLCEAFGIPLTNAHAAWADAEATGRLLYRLLARRYTNLFAAPDMLAEAGGAFLERGLIHRTARGELVRSISEVVVADALHAEGIDYHYEKALRGADGVERYPDFTAEDPATGITVYWEHLGMLSDPTYARRWEKKLKWYEAMDLQPNGPENAKGERLVTSQNRHDGAIDSAQIRQQVRDVFEL